MKREIKIGDPVVVLDNYNAIPGECLKVNAKSIKVKPRPPGDQVARYLFRNFSDKNYKKEKVVHADDSVVFVWETWKGVNGRGGYRIEHNLYNEFKLPARSWIKASGGDFVTETSLGVIDPNFLRRVEEGFHRIFSKRVSGDRWEIQEKAEAQINKILSEAFKR